MRMILPLLLVSSIASADVAITYVSKDNPAGQVMLKAEAEKHVEALNKATHGKSFQLQISLTKLEQKTDTKCTVSMALGGPSTSLLATVTSGAGTTGATASAAADCIGAVVGAMIDKQIVTTIEKTK
jgi:hypothetical protein